MTDNKTLIDQLDRYFDGTLSPAEKAMLEERMRNDNDFKIFANNHFTLLKTIKQQREHESLKAELDIIHQSIPQENSIESNVRTINLKKYWPTIAVAASVALISVIGTLLSTVSLKEQQNSQFRALSREVNQIKKSQQTLINDIAEKEKAEVRLAKYVGTGFMISSNGYLITSTHVVEGADSVYVENAKFGKIKAEVLIADKVNDIAILRIKSEKLSLPYTISSREADLGENVFTLGFPKEDIVYGEGTISSSSGYRQNESSYQVAVPVNPGNSGGPLLNKQGDVIGMISGIQTETYAAAFAVKSARVLDLIKSLPTDSLNAPVKLPSQNKIRNLSRVEQVKKLRDYVFLVNVYEK
jgi:serine protease Do